MTRDEALEAAICGKRTHCELEFMAATAGADAELARVVAWLRERAARTKVRRMRWILLWLAREIELGAHWKDEQ